MQSVSVECSFDEQGKVQVRRLARNGNWETIEQGRQWLEEDGRHVLVLLGGSRPAELILKRDNLAWFLKGDASPGVYVV